MFISTHPDFRLSKPHVCPPASVNDISMNDMNVLTFVSQAYPAFTRGVSGSFLLDLRFPAHRLAAVRLAEAENFQER